ncbi:hypothetical protein SS50377_22400 [Spironucleus salmonicida]|uniref:Uncharacterized protein n=1 Tax=Spironucleus salmonicida TaxID=348837 RepID=V6LEI1_9EUKA|nr:hypothetical protein SS50377_22400 [Spironucleus salmonicida]|eukprot:EST42106.1 Hypothetical protein SS50377_18415 [Spironucleus salmonicida]
MLLNLSNNAVTVQPMQISFHNPSTLYYSYNSTLVQVRDSIQPKLLKLDGKVSLTQNFAYAQDLNTIYQLPNLVNAGIVTSFEPLLNLFEFNKSLILHFKDRVICFSDSQTQTQVEIQATTSTSFNNTIIFGSGVTLFTYSPSLKLVQSIELELQMTEQIQQIQVIDKYILVLSTIGRVLLADNIRSSPIEIFKGDVTKIVAGPVIQGLIIAIIESNKLNIVKVSNSGNGVQTLYQNTFEENIRDFLFIPEFQMQRFLNDINAIAIVLTSKLQAIILENTDLFLSKTLFRNIESEYVQLQKLKNGILKAKSPTEECIAPVSLNIELIRSSTEISLQITSPQFCVYFDVIFPSGLFVSQGEFNNIQPNSIRIFAKEKANLTFKMMPGFQYWKESKFQIYAISESYQTGYKQIILDSFSSFKQIQKLPKIDAFLTAEIDEKLANLSISTPADFLNVKVDGEKTIIKGSSYITVNGYMNEKSQLKNLQIKFDQKGMVTRINAFVKVFSGVENPFEYEKMFQDLVQSQKVQNKKYDDNLIRKGLNLIKSGLSGSNEMGIAMIKKALE